MYVIKKLLGCITLEFYSYFTLDSFEFKFECKYAYCIV